jgi:tRNA 5-methylaminomethyl-2-thiouridine biosynthesis bifunctional protein
MRPAGLVAAQIAAASADGKLNLHAGANVHALRRNGESWLALSSEDKVIASAPVVILANAEDAARLATIGAPLKRVRGQLTLLPGERVSALRAVLAGAGHLAPAADGTAVAGATYDFDDADPEPRAAGHAGNLARLEKLVPALAGIDAAGLGGSVGFRCVSADRLPLIGALPDSPPAPLTIAPSRRGISRGATKATGWWEAGAASARGVPRAPGLYGLLALGSRGLTWAALGAEQVAGMIEGEPPPLEGDLLDAVDPGRFALRRLRRGKG